MKLKKCKGCGKTYPATRENFYRNGASKDGLYNKCKDCIRAYQNKYYNNPRPTVEKPKEVYTTVENYKEKALAKYFVGQILNIRLRDLKGNILERKKARIIKFYPHHVLCLVDNCRECFTYQDLHNLTTYKKGEK